MLVYTKIPPSSYIHRKKLLKLFFKGQTFEINQFIPINTTALIPINTTALINLLNYDVTTSHV